MLREFEIGVVLLVEEGERLAAGVGVLLLVDAAVPAEDLRTVEVHLILLPQRIFPPLLLPLYIFTALALHLSQEEALEPAHRKHLPVHVAYQVLPVVLGEGGEGQAFGS